MPARPPLERMRELLREPAQSTPPVSGARLATPRTPQPPPVEAKRDSLPSLPLGRAAEPPAISPRMTAVFGGLFGMAVVASIVALLIQVFPVHNQRAAAAEPSDGEDEQPSDRPRAQPKKRERKLLPMPWRIDKLEKSHLVVRGTMDRRSFIVALEEAGVPKKESYRILKAFEGVREFDRSRKSDKFAVAMKRGTKQVAAFEYEVDLTEIYQARTGKDGLLKGERLDMKVREEEFATSFYVGKDLVKSYEFVGLEKGLLDVIDDAFNGRTSHEAFEEGGVVKVIVVEMTALGRFVRYQRIKALEYRPPDPAKEPLRAYWFQGAKTYVDERGRHPSHRGWRAPVPNAPITSHFNPKRMHPVLKKVMPHNGTDYGAPAGAPVYAAYRGKVVFVGAHGPSGNLVLIEHPGGIETGYAHLSRFADGLKADARVGTRQLIGYVGSTGRSTGPHLHFSAKRNGKFFDPLELKLDALELLPVEERSTFLQQKQLLDRALEAIALPEPPPEEPSAPEPPADDDDASATSEEHAEEEGEEEGEEARKAKPKAKDKKNAKASSEDSDGLSGPDLSGPIE